MLHTHPLLRDLVVVYIVITIAMAAGFLCARAPWRQYSRLPHLALVTSLVADGSWTILRSHWSAWLFLTLILNLFSWRSCCT